MIDIVSAEDGKDLGVLDTQVMRAANILSTQVQSLEYAPDLGIDLKFFLDEGIVYQNESFRNHVIETLSNQGINVVSVQETIETLYRGLGISVGADESSTALVR